MKNILLLNEKVGHMQISQESRLFSAVLFSFDFPLIDFYFERQRRVSSVPASPAICNIVQLGGSREHIFPYLSCSYVVNVTP